MHRFAGGRQPKQPIPPGDSAFFYHGICVATSAFNDPKGFLLDTVLSHSCKLNICLGGGGFNCIAIYAGTSFIFNVGQQIRSTPLMPTGALFMRKETGQEILGLGTEESGPSLPPPFPATIIGGTGRYVRFKVYLCIIPFPQYIILLINSISLSFLKASKG